MLSDAHCHPCDLAQIFTESETERRRLGVLAASSACGMDEFAYNEKLSHNAAQDKAAPLLPCFGIHPQVFKIWNERGTNNNELLAKLDMLASEGRIAAIGECGFDLYNAAFRETEKTQDQYFTSQIETALKFNLPVVIHVRRAMHKIFAMARILSKCRAVIFHSWPGTFEEALSLLKRGVNAYFSFGNVIMLNHKQALRSCALLPAQRVLTETDAPYQMRRGESFSQWADLPLILEAAATLRSKAGNNITAKELEMQIEANFRNAFV